MAKGKKSKKSQEGGEEGQKGSSGEEEIRQEGRCTVEEGRQEIGKEVGEEGCEEISQEGREEIRQEGSAEEGRQEEPGEEKEGRGSQAGRRSPGRGARARTRTRTELGDFGAVSPNARRRSQLGSTVGRYLAQRAAALAAALFVWALAGVYTASGLLRRLDSSKSRFNCRGLHCDSGFQKMHPKGH